MVKNIITFGTFDLFHIGHLFLLQRARNFGERLIVGVSSDELNFRKKGHFPIFREADRKAIVLALRCVDDVFTEESMELKMQYILEHKADILVMGDDWQGKFDDLSTVCEVRYLPRTADISTTDIKADVIAKSLK